MKRILPLLAAMIALTTVLPGKAQTGKYYIDGRETTREELLKLPAGTIESMANSVENGLPVVRIKLKPEGEEQAPATGQQEKNTATPHEKAMQLVRGIYEQHTLLKEGDLAADFRATKYAGGDLTLTALRGKVVLLNFWLPGAAPACGNWRRKPCRKSFSNGLPQTANSYSCQSPIPIQKRASTSFSQATNSRITLICAT